MSFSKLREKYGNDPRVILNNMAASKESNSFIGFTDDKTSTMNRVAEGEADNIISVPCTRLDDYCSQNKIDSVDYLKIDTEGHEISVLEGMSNILHRVKVIELEAAMNAYNDYHVSYIDIFKLMLSRGFYLYKIYEQTLEWGGGGYPVLRRANPVFVNRSIVGPLDAWFK